MGAKDSSKMPEKRKIVRRKEVVVSVPVVRVPHWLQGFVDFVREQGVVGIAIAFVFGVAAKGVVDSLVINIINPILGLLYGKGGQLTDKFWCLRDDGVQCTTRIGYGALASQLINFLIVAAVVYFIVRSLKLDKLDKEKPKK